MDVDVGPLEDGFAGFVQRLLPRHADVREQMRVEGDVQQHLALAVPRPSKAPAAPASGERGSRVFLMKSKTMARPTQGQGWHRQAPRVVKCLGLDHSNSPA